MRTGVRLKRTRARPLICGRIDTIVKSRSGVAEFQLKRWASVNINEREVVYHFRDKFNKVRYEVL